MTSLLLVASMLLLAAVLCSAWVELRRAYLQGADKAAPLPSGPSECPAGDTLPSDAIRTASSAAEPSASETQSKVSEGHASSRHSKGIAAAARSVPESERMPSAAQPKPPAGQKTARVKRRRGGKR